MEPLIRRPHQNAERLPPTIPDDSALPERERYRQRRALYEDGWHMLLRDLEAEVVLNDVVHWIEAPRAPLPSGAEARALARLGEEE